MIEEQRKCQCGTPMGKHPHSKNSQENYFCANCDVVQAREEAGPALRIDDDGAHIYWADPVEGCWVAFRRVDCVGEEELPERRLPTPEAREVTDAEVDAARSVIVALAPYNMELRQDGSEDREAAAYVSGVQAASDAIPRALAAAAAVRS